MLKLISVLKLINTTIHNFLWGLFALELMFVIITFILTLVSAKVLLVATLGFLYLLIIGLAGWLLKMLLFDEYLGLFRRK